MNLRKSATAIIAAFMLMLLSVPAFALSVPELERLTAPVALYQDELLSHILSASTHPDEITEAAEYLRDNGGTVSEMPSYEWDSGVKALLYTPNILAKMDSNPEWTKKLGTAVKDQLNDVMTAIQNLRKKAMKSKSFTDSEYQNVVVNNGNITIEQKKDTDKVYYPTYSTSDLLLGNVVSLAFSFAVAGIVSDWWRCNYLDWGWNTICYRPWYLTNYRYAPGGYYHNWYYMDNKYISVSRTNLTGYVWYPPRRGYMPPPPKPMPPPPPPGTRRRDIDKMHADRNYVPMPKDMSRTPYHNNGSHNGKIHDDRHDHHDHHNDNNRPGRPGSNDPKIHDRNDHNDHHVRDNDNNRPGRPGSNDPKIHDGNDRHEHHVRDNNRPGSNDPKIHDRNDHNDHHVRDNNRPGSNDPKIHDRNDRHDHHVRDNDGGNKPAVKHNPSGTNKPAVKHSPSETNRPAVKHNNSRVSKPSGSSVHHRSSVGSHHRRAGGGRHRR